MNQTNTIHHDAAIVRDASDEAVLEILKGFSREEKMEIISCLQDALRDRQLSVDVPPQEKV